MARLDDESCAVRLGDAQRELDAFAEPMRTARADALAVVAHVRDGKLEDDRARAKALRGAVQALARAFAQGEAVRVVADMLAAEESRCSERIGQREERERTAERSRAQSRNLEATRALSTLGPSDRATLGWVTGRPEDTREIKTP